MTIETTPAAALVTPIELQIWKMVADLSQVPRLQVAGGAEVIEKLRQTMDERLELFKVRFIVDEHYLGGASYRGIAYRLGLSHNTPNFWINERGLGPKHYVAVRLTDDGYDVQKAPLDRVGLCRLAERGYRIAPAMMLLDLEDIDSIDGGALWNKLEQLSPVAVQEARPA